MTDFNPGPGWCEVTDGHGIDNGQEYIEFGHGGSLEFDRLWVRESPVPPLPTAPYTVIRVTWEDDSGINVLMLTEAGVWMLAGDDFRWLPDDMPGLITGFEVLSEPRAVTAKAVLDQVNDLLDGDTPWITVITRVAREFGVES